METLQTPEVLVFECAVTSRKRGQSAARKEERV